MGEARLLLGTFGAAWLILVAGLLLGAGAGVKGGFALFVASGVLVIAVGLALTTNYRGVTDALTERYEQIGARRAISSTSPFGGALLIAIGVCQIVVGLLSI